MERQGWGAPPIQALIQQEREKSKKQKEDLQKKQTGTVKNSLKQEVDAGDQRKKNQQQSSQGKKDPLAIYAYFGMGPGGIYGGTRGPR